MKYIELTTAKGKPYCYYRRGGKRYPLPLPDAPDFATEYAKLHESFEGTGRVDDETVAGMVQAYLLSAEYKGLKPRTRQDYRYYLDEVSRQWGRIRPNMIESRDVLQLRDRLSDTPGKANAMVRTIRLLYRWGRPRGWCQDNPADLYKDGVKALKMGSHKAWPRPLVDKFFATAPEHLAHAALFGLYTGQRRGDVLKMRWSDIEGAGIKVVQEKTGREIWVPFHPVLQTTIVSMKKQGPFILTTKTGMPWKRDTFHDQFSGQLIKIGGKGYVFHGLRKTLSSWLSEAGCSTEQIKAMTGHESDSMAAYYANGADQRRLAMDAITALAGTEQKQKLPNFLTKLPNFQKD